MGTA